MRTKYFLIIIVAALIFSLNSCEKKPDEQKTKYFLNISFMGDGGGLVKAVDEGLVCKKNCKHEYPESTKLSLTAIADDSSEFVAWTGACKGSNEKCTLAMDAEKNVGVSFKKKPSNFILRVSKRGEGVGQIGSSPTGINCGTDCSERYPEKTVVVLSATAGEASVFSGWSGDCNGNVKQCEISMTSVKNVAAIFDKEDAKSFNLSVSKLGKGIGTITSNPGSINCGDLCQDRFIEKTALSLTATAATGSEFVAWSGDCSGGTKNCNLTMDKEKTVTAEFKLQESKTFSLAVAKHGNGDIKSEPSGIDCGGDCSEDYPMGTDIVLTAIAKSGNEFVSWSGACSGSSARCKLKMTADKSVEAKFAEISSGSGTRYYISTSGDDDDDGLSEQNAWATFKYADSKLQAGDTLIIMDGTYDQIIRPSHSGNAKQGYISYKAQHNFKAILAPTVDTNESPIMVFSCPGCGGGWDNPVMGYLIFEGIVARSIGENSAIWLGSADRAKEDEMTHHIIVRNSGFYGSAQETNTSVVALGNNLRDSLFEDSFSYGRSRKAGSAFGCLRVVVRRSVMRYDYWEGDEYKPNDPRTTFSGYNTQDSIFENMIVVDTAPTPPGYEADRAGFAASGNETPATVSGSSRNKYLGLIVLNNYGNGIEANGGSGSPNENIVFKNNLAWKNMEDGYAFNVQGNDNGSEFSFMTLGKSFVGFRLDPYPHAPITHEKVSNIFSTENKFGYYYGENSLDLFKNNTALNNSEDDNDIEAKYAPDISVRFLDPAMIKGHERGATIVNRYENGRLTEKPLWPFPNEEVIKEFMCNSNDLKLAHRVASMGEGWVPAWCKTDKTLTEYIWEFNGASCPADICNY